MNNEFPPDSLYQPAGAPTMQIANNWTRLCIARHYMAINVGFMDGHVAKIDLPDLWTLPWHGPATGPKMWQPATETTNPKMSQIRQWIKDRYKG